MKDYINVYLRGGEYSLGAVKFRSAEGAMQGVDSRLGEHIGAICVTTRREVSCVPAQPYASVAAPLGCDHDIVAWRLHRAT